TFDSYRWEIATLIQSGETTQSPSTYAITSPLATLAPAFLTAPIFFPEALIILTGYWHAIAILPSVEPLSITITSTSSFGYARLSTLVKQLPRFSCSLYTGIKTLTLG